MEKKYEKKYKDFTIRRKPCYVDAYQHYEYSIDGEFGRFASLQLAKDYINKLIEIENEKSI